MANIDNESPGIDGPAASTSARQPRHRESERERILIVCDDSSRINAFANLFRSIGFPVERKSELPSAEDRNGFGAVVHLAHTYNELCELLDDSSTSVPKDEWVFIEGEDGDFHCTIQLTPAASFGLESFVRSLWSIFSVT